MEVRTLRSGEREAVLALLEGSAPKDGDPAARGWQLPDGWQPRDFFSRSLLDDPEVADEDLWAAFAAGRPVACVQIFPRWMLVRDLCVPTGGIGTVFTEPRQRGRGLAQRLLARALEAMRGAGLELGLLFAERIAWYEGQGWHAWPCERRLLLRGTSRAGNDPRILHFDRARDLEEVRTLHAAFSRGRSGCLLRPQARWQVSLRHAGNPREEFLVARDDSGKRLLAYLRAAVLDGLLTCLEYAHAPGAADALAGLLCRLLEPRPDDALRPPGNHEPDLRTRLLAGPVALDGELPAALSRRGVVLAQQLDTSAMLRCLDADALARRLGLPAPGPGAERALLEQLLPPQRFGFWPADRF